MRQWRLALERRDAGSFATASFLDTETSAKPVELSISRQRIDGERVTEVTLFSEEAIDARTLFGDAEWLTQFGERVQIQGSLWCRQSKNDWSLDYAGTLEGLDLGRLVNDRFPHRLTGNATAEIHQLLIEGATIQQLTGRLNARDGEISRSLLSAAEQYLEMSAGGADFDVVGYDQLAAVVNLDARGLIIRGEAGSGAVLMAGETTLLAENDGEPKPSYRLIQTLANERSSRFFWTESCKPLLDLLPPPP